MSAQRRLNQVGVAVPSGVSGGRFAADTADASAPAPPPALFEVEHLVAPKAAFGAAASVVSPATRKSDRLRAWQVATHQDVLLHDGHVYATDSYLAVRVRTEAADGAWQLGLDARATAEAVAAKPDASTRPRLGGAFMEVAGEPTVPQPEDRALVILTGLYERFRPDADCGDLAVAQVRATAQSSDGDDRAAIGGYLFSASTARAISKASRHLAVRHLRVEQGSAGGRRMLRLSAPGVEFLLAANDPVSARNAA